MFTQHYTIRYGITGWLNTSSYDISLRPISHPVSGEGLDVPNLSEFKK